MSPIRLASEEPIGPEVSHPSQVQFGVRLGDVPLPDGLGGYKYEDLMDELIGMTRILQGKADAPVSSPYLDLMEVATAYLSRAYEIEMLIHQGEHDGVIERGDSLQKFRTGPLESFISMARRMCELGSRRLSQEALLTEQRRGLGERWS